MLFWLQQMQQLQASIVPFPHEFHRHLLCVLFFSTTTNPFLRRRPWQAYTSTATTAATTTAADHKPGNPFWY